jgi:exodeoxyribonuclease VII large subunit
VKESRLSQPGSEVRKVYTPSRLLAEAKLALEGEFGSVWLEGEVSNLRRPPSGHLYFSLKDAGAALGGVVFGGLTRLPSARHLLEGVKVLVYGRFTAYERSGQCQVIVERVEPLGLGALQKAFDALKKKLEAEGLFATEKKRPIPRMPFTVGLVTSPSGAAVRDLVNVLARRFPRVSIVLAPCRVQGEGAAAEIAAAIALQNRARLAEVLIIGRGGGSAEDLWAFNQEPAVRAIAGSRIPTISAVGHEIDWTLADYAADLRAPTPSAAAELAVRPEQEVRAELADASFRLRTGLSRAAELSRARLAEFAASPAMARPVEELLGARRQRLDELAAALAAGARAAVSAARERIAADGARLGALSPLAVLARGYSVTFDESGRALTEARAAAAGSKIRTVLARGELLSRVEESTHGQER